MKIAAYNMHHISLGSGPELCLLSLLPELKKQGHSVTLISTNAQYNASRKHLSKQLTSQGIEEIVLTGLRVPLSGSIIPRSLRQFQGRSFDALYYLDGFAFQEIIAHRIAKMTGARFIYGNHANYTTHYTLHNLYQKTIAPFTIRSADGVQVMSTGSYTYFKQFNPNTHLIYTRPLLPDTPPIVFDKKSTYPTTNVIFWGRLDAQKNIPDLLAVIAQFNGDDEFQFFIAGDGKYTEQVRKQANAQSNLTYLGYINHDLLPETLKDKHILLSLSHYEIFYNVLVEAASSGLLPITTITAGPASDFREQVLYKAIPHSFTDKQVISDIRSAHTFIHKEPEAYRKYIKKTADEVQQFLSSQGDISKFISLLEGTLNA